MSIKAQMDNKHVDRSLFITWGRGCGGFWLCHEKKSPDNPIMLFNILMIPPLSGSNWQSIFCSPFILCWRRLISPPVSLENLTCPKFSVNRTKRDSKLRYCSRGVKNEGDRVEHDTCLLDTYLAESLLLPSRNKLLLIFHRSLMAQFLPCIVSLA